MLDVIEVAESHTGKTMADVFNTVLTEFGILEKVSSTYFMNIHKLKLHVQLLGMTGDNATANDAMINELGELVPTFDGSCSRGRCFDHTINLCAKSVVRPFDMPKKGKEKTDLVEAQDALAELLEDVEWDECGLDLAAGENEDLDEDDVEGWQDERDEMSEEERNALEESITPVRLVLVKVRQE